MTIGSWDEIDSNLFFDSLKGYPVINWTAFIKPEINSDDEFKPVPTAVPPWAKKYKSSTDFKILSRQFSICDLNALNSCSNVSGVASWRCVRPIFTIPLNSLLFFLDL